MRVLVTGASGFIGQHVVRQLLETPEIDEVVGFDLAPFPLHDDVGSRFRGVVGDVCDFAALHEVALNADAVIHLAALASVPASIDHPRKTHDVNATGTLNVLESARLAGGSKHVTLASSSAVYGEHPEEMKHENLPPSFLSPYAASKGVTEGYANAYRKAFGMNTLAFRFFNVFGPGQLADHVYAAVIPRFLDAIMSGRPLEVYGDGEQSRDFVSVKTVSDILVKASIRQLTADTAVNLASGNPISINALIAELSSIHGSKLDVVYLPARKGDIKHSAANIELMEALVPDSFRQSLREDLKSVYDWFSSKKP